MAKDKKDKKEDKKARIKAGKQKGITVGYSYEYVSDLQDLETRVKEFNIMRKSDTQVGGVLRAIKLPIRKADWDITGGREEVRSFIKDNLFVSMSTSFSDLLRWILTALDFGFSVFEKVFRYDNTETKIIWKKFLFLPQSTIYKIEVEDDGGIKEVVQYPAEPEGVIDEADYIHIPVDYVLVFSLDREGDWYGESILRNAYGSWKIKDSLVKIDAIKHDRFGVGVPFMKLSANYTDDDVVLARKILSRMRSHEYSYMIVPPNVSEFGILEFKSPGTNPIESIRYHDEAISKSLLTQFIDLGTSNSGNRALGQSFIQLFLMSLNALADFVGETFSKYAIRQLVDYNFGEQEEYPELTHSKIEINDIVEMLKILNDLYKNGVIGLSNEDENIIREKIGLSPVVEGKTKKNEGKEVKGEEHIHGVLQFNEKGEPLYFRELAPIEQKINWKQYTEDLNTLEKKFTNDLKVYRDKQIKSLVYDIVKLEKDIQKVKPRYSDMYEKIIKDYQVKAFNMGVDQVKSEKKKQFIEHGISDVKLYEFEAIPQEVLELININAQIGAEVLSSRTKAYITNLFIQYKNEGLSNKEIAGRIYADTLGKGDKVIAEEFQRVQAQWNRGRMEYGLNDDEVKGAYYSAVMDGNVCDVCSSTDREYNAYHDKPFDVEFLSKVAPTPNPDCRGGQACRCTWVYEYFVEKGGVQGFPPDYPNSLKKNEPKDVSLIDRINGARSVRDLEFALKESGVAKYIEFKDMDITHAKVFSELLYKVRKGTNVNIDFIISDKGVKGLFNSYRDVKFTEAELNAFKEFEDFAKRGRYLGFQKTLSVGGKKVRGVVLNSKYFNMLPDIPEATIAFMKDKYLIGYYKDVDDTVGVVLHELIHLIDDVLKEKTGSLFSYKFRSELTNVLAGVNPPPGHSVEWTESVRETFKKNYKKLDDVMRKYRKTAWDSSGYEPIAYLQTGYILGYITEKNVGKAVYSHLEKWAKKIGLDKIKEEAIEIYKKHLEKIGIKDIGELFK